MKPLIDIGHEIKCVYYPTVGLDFTLIPVLLKNTIVDCIVFTDHQMGLPTVGQLQERLNGWEVITKDILFSPFGQ